MTKLVVEELKTVALAQSFTIAKDRNYNIKYIRPYLYVHNIPAGTFTLSIKSGVTTVASVTFTSAAMKTALGTSNNYFHIWHRLAFSSNISLKKATYSFELSSSGYTFSETSFIGWVKEHEYRFNALDYTISNILQSPLALQLIIFRPSESY